MMESCLRRAQMMELFKFGVFPQSKGEDDGTEDW